MKAQNYCNKNILDKQICNTHLNLDRNITQVKGAEMCILTRY